MKDEELMAVTQYHRLPAQSFTGDSFRKNVLLGGLGLLVLGFLGFGVKQATRSSLFLLRSVEVEPLSADYPLSRETVLELARVPLGTRSLFDLNLGPVEARLLRHPWIKGVVVGKQFPGTLSLKIVERTPVALLAGSDGRVIYLEDDGSTFEDGAMVYPRDLPIFTGFKSEDSALLKRLTSFLQKSFDRSVFPGIRLSSVSYDDRLGLRAMVTYPMKNQRIMRTVLELGMNVEEASGIPMDRLRKVLDYIAARSQPASKIWLGDGKKIVVKFSRGS